MIDSSFQLSQETLGKMVEEVGADKGPLLILTTVGAKTGEQRSVPLGYLELEGQLLVVGSMAGSVRNPPWYYNLMANPQVEVELNGKKFDAQAQVLQGAERERIFKSVCAIAPVYGDIQASVERTIPVIALTAI